MKGEFVGVGGGRISWRTWQAAHPEAQVVIVHGYGEHAGRYERFATRLADERFIVWANDHHGHGLSEGPRGLIRRLNDAVADLDEVVEMARNAHPGLPLFMFAHSMGGTIGLSYALEHQDKLDGLILSSAAVSLKGLGLNPLLRGAARVVGTIAPRLPVNKLALEGISRDPDEEELYMNDPLVHRGKQPARTVAEMLQAMTDLPTEAGRLQIPLLVLAGSADPLVPVEGSRDIVERTGSSDKEIIVYESFVHELINEPPEDRERVTRDIIDWLIARL